MPIFRFDNRILLFVHIPKTGGTSVEKMLKDAGGVEALRQGQQIPGLSCTPQHFHAEILGALIPAAFYDYAFTIVRNPFDRLSSEFRMRVLGAGRDLGFDSWVDRVLARYSKNPFANDNHIRPQVEFLFDGVQVFRFEDSPMLQIADRLQMLGIRTAPDTPWERRGEAVALRLSRQTASAVRAFYAEDFARLGYRPDDHGSLSVSEGDV